MNTSTFDARFKTPFTCIVSGSPMSGKTTFIRRLLEDRHIFIDNEIDYLVWFYGQHTPFIDILQKQALGLKTTVVHQLPTSFEDYIQPDKRGLFVIDDLMVTAGASTSVTDLFCNKVQHANLSVILLMQNLFYHGSERTTLVRCAHYLIIFKNPLDASVPLFLAQKIMPLQRKLFMNIYDQATAKPYGYLLIDGKQDTPKAARFRTDILEEGVQRVFVVDEPLSAKNKSPAITYAEKETIEGEERE